MKRNSWLLNQRLTLVGAYDLIDSEIPKRAAVAVHDGASRYSSSKRKAVKPASTGDKLFHGLARWWHRVGNHEPAHGIR